MKKIIIILLLVLLNCKVSVGSKDLQIQSPPTVFDKNYYVICHRGVEYITRQWGESSFTLAVDRNNRPIECREK